MRRSPRLGQGNDRSDAGYRSAAAPASLPLTPRGQRNGKALDNLVHSLEAKWQLGLRTWTDPRSPAHHTSAADRLYAKIQRLYFSSPLVLNEALATFESTATRIPLEQRFEELSNIIIEKLQNASPIPKTGAPSSTKNKPPKTLQSSRPCKYLLTKIRLDSVGWTICQCARIDCTLP